MLNFLFAKKKAFSHHAAYCRLVALVVLVFSPIVCKSQGSFPENDWMIEMWTGNDAPYRQARNAIDKRIARGEDVALIAYNLRKQTTHPADTTAQFKWAYAAYRTVKKKKDTGSYQTMQDIVTALERGDDMNPPHSYEYSRLRFLARVNNGAESKLKTVGARLLKRNPRDYEVMFCQLEVLYSGTNRKEEALRIGYANTLIKVQPYNPKVYNLAGNVYDEMCTYRVLHSLPEEPALYNKALFYWNKALRLTPLSDPEHKRLAAKIKSAPVMRAYDNSPKMRAYFKAHPPRL